MHERRIRAERFRATSPSSWTATGAGPSAADSTGCRVTGRGSRRVRATVRAAHELGVRFLTLYAFSTENWSRPKGEVDALMGLLEHYLDRRTRRARSQRHPAARDRPPRSAARSWRAQKLEEALRAHARQQRDDGGLRALLRRPHRDRRRGAQARARRRSGQARSRADRREDLRAYLYDAGDSRIRIC